jgi:L-asparaginase II
VRAGGHAERVAQNCSGKHAGMLATAVARKWPVAGYWRPEHPVQLEIAALAEELAGEPVAHTGVDGCGAPQFALSLRGLTRAIGRMAAAREGPSARVVAEMRAHPTMVGGTGRPVTELMEAVRGLLAKDGAEGVQVAAWPDGTAIGVKIGDGAARARMPVTATALRYCGVPAATLATVRGATPETAGGVEVAGELAEVLDAVGSTGG